MSDYKGTVVKGSANLQTSVAGENIIEKPLVDFEILNDQDCHISFNGGDYIFVRANQGVGVNVANTVQNNSGNGINLSSSDYNIIGSNEIISNLSYGIYLGSTANDYNNICSNVAYNNTTANLTVGGGTGNIGNVNLTT